MKKLMLVGNPNCGKTTLFNALTGANQKVGNWSGVTVEKMEGNYLFVNDTFTVTDLPGIYSIYAESLSEDEWIAQQQLQDVDDALIINIVDAVHLERHLFLTTQLLEKKRPMIVVLNMIDLANRKGIQIDVASLEQQLGCSVIAMSAHNIVDIERLKKTIAAYKTAVSNSPIIENIKSDPMLRFDSIHTCMQKAIKRNNTQHLSFSTSIDNIVLNRFLGLPLFFMLMYLMFYFSIHFGGQLQDWVDKNSEYWLVTWMQQKLEYSGIPAIIIALLTEGIGRGINTTLTFLPVMACMYFFLSLLESSGYMARAAIIMDKVMRMLGLPGKAFVPMIIGFGCNVPAIMSTRTLESGREKWLTVFMSPFMSCSARLAIYAVFVSVFFKNNGTNVIFALYLFGIIMAVFTGILLRNSVLKGTHAPLVMELPSYHMPSLARLIKDTRYRLQLFWQRAIRMIVPACMVLSLLMYGPFQHTLVSLGAFLTPLFHPMGIQPDNWPATVGLLSGLLAKEVVVGTLDTLYSAVANPSQTSYVAMGQYFQSGAAAFAYLIFVLLYVPCISTMSAIRQETNRYWMGLSVSWSLIIAYTMAVLFYQCATFWSHPMMTAIWILAVFLIWGSFGWIIKKLPPITFSAQTSCASKCNGCSDIRA